MGKKELGAIKALGENIERFGGESPQDKNYGQK